MPAEAQRPAGRSMRELRAILAADTARWERLAELWNELTEDQQARVVACAEELSEAAE